MRLPRVIAACWLVVAATGARVFAQAAQGEFVPVVPGASKEAIPAAPLVFVAYAFVWVALVAYVVLLWRRLGKVERELTDLNGRLKSTRRS
ncbi:MAG TPA: CcmD family protein [Vicinamibacterales bacterium]|nr:CcmD family protein [Vicinamibacterales bacterium]